MLSGEPMTKDQLEDVLTTITAQIHSIEQKLMRAALSGHMSGGSKTDIRLKLNYIAQQVDKLPQRT